MNVQINCSPVVKWYLSTYKYLAKYASAEIIMIAKVALEVGSRSWAKSRKENSVLNSLSVLTLDLIKRPSGSSSNQMWNHIIECVP